MKITEENMHDNCEFTCSICNTKAQRVSQLEPELGFIGKLTGKFEQICQKCWDEQPDRDKVMKPIFEAMFVVAVRADGEPALIMEEGIETPYRRSPTMYEIKSAVKEIAANLDSLDTANRLGGFLAQMQQQQMQHQSSSIQLPRKKG